MLLLYYYNFIIDWRSFHNEELLSLYRSLNVDIMIMSKFVMARMKVGRRAFKLLTANPTGKSSLGRPRRIWEDNIRMDLE